MRNRGAHKSDQNFVFLQKIKCRNRIFWLYKQKICFIRVKFDSVFIEKILFPRKLIDNKIHDNKFINHLENNKRELNDNEFNHLIELLNYVLFNLNTFKIVNEYIINYSKSTLEFNYKNIDSDELI